MLWMLDLIFAIHLTAIVWSAGREIISGHPTEAMKRAVGGMLSLAFFMAALGHFLFGFPVEFLFKRFVTEGYKMIPILYQEYIQPLLKLIRS